MPSNTDTDLAADSTLTIGVAISVPEPFGSFLRSKRASFGDPAASWVPSHVTLIPPTVVSAEQLEPITQALSAAALCIAPFEMALRGTGTFRPVSPVVFVAVSQGISTTELLASAVRAELGAPDPSFPFHPHVTVAHEIDDASLDLAYAELADFSCEFDVSDFALYLHTDETGWQLHQRFVLAG